MRINKNIYSLNVYRNYTNNTKANLSALEKISTGNKVNSAKDNPIKLEKSENLKMQIRSLEAANRNLQDGTSMIQTADGGMSSISDALIRIKELIVQSGNGSYTEEDRKVLQTEIDSMKEHIIQTAEITEFNGNKILSIDSDEKKIQVGYNVGEIMTLPAINITEKNLNIEGLDVINPDNLADSIEKVDYAIQKVSQYRSRYGAIQNRIETTIENNNQSSLKLQSGSSDIVDADIAEELAEVSRTDVLMQSSIAIMAQCNDFPNDVLNILSNLIR